MPSTDLQFDDDNLDDEMGAPELEEGELTPDPNEPLFEEINFPIVAEAPSFSNDALLEGLRSAQFSADGTLANGWLDTDDFLCKQYGLRHLSEMNAEGWPLLFTKRVGFVGPADVSLVDLYDSVINSTPLPNTCDLSELYDYSAGDFPDRSTNTILNVRAFGGGYLVSVNDGEERPWKLFIKDPLTLVRIEREGWHLRGDDLVSNLVGKGLPFKILYPICQAGGTFYPHPEPPIHPDGRSPTLFDYLAYRLDVADFFTKYPHAYAAALCAGGMLWRIAVDVLPMPTQDQLIQPFHHHAVAQTVIDGKFYWSPCLTAVEEDVIVGIYKWAGKPDYMLYNKFIGIFHS
jgi:hypothetical protein